MRILFLGDIVGPKATACIAGRLPYLRDELRADFIIVNADNCIISGPSPMTGSGLDLLSAQRLLAHGADIVTTGFHAFDSPDCSQVLALERVLRSHNRSTALPGKGVISLEHNGEWFTCINLATTTLSENERPAYETFVRIERRGHTIIHSVGDPHQTRVFAHAVDGEVAAVVGTFGHEPSLRHYVLPRGTLLVPDVGMVGPLGGIGGFNPSWFVAQVKGEDPTAGIPYHLLEQLPMCLDAVLLAFTPGTSPTVHRLHRMLPLE
jgi:hypothetical protein